MANNQEIPKEDFKKLGKNVLRGERTPIEKPTTEEQMVDFKGRIEALENKPEPEEPIEESKQFEDIKKFDLLKVLKLYVVNIYDDITKGLVGLLTDAQKTDLTDGGTTTLHSHVDGLTIVNTSVFDADAPTSYTNLDLSSIVGSNAALVYIRVLNDSVNVNQYRFQTNGEASTVSSSIGLGGVTMADPPQTEINYVLVLTDSSGIIEWKADSAYATKLTVLAYIN